MEEALRRMLSTAKELEDRPRVDVITWDQQHAHVITPGTRFWGIFADLCQKTGAAGKLVPDAYLAALAIEHGCEFVTADKDFRRFPGLRWRHPLN